MPARELSAPGRDNGTKKDNVEKAKVRGQQLAGKMNPETGNESVD